MTGMKPAIDRIEAAIENKESILIYGDYDVDGTTAIVILKTAIELCGGTADFHVPHRIRDGYDMRDDVIERAAGGRHQAHHQRGHGHPRLCSGGDSSKAGRRPDRHRPPPSRSARYSVRAGRDQSQSAGLRVSLQGSMRRGVAFKVAQALIERRIPENDEPIADVVHESGRHRDYR